MNGHARNRVTVPVIETSSARARHNIDIIQIFFESYLKDKALFYSLWVENDPLVITPFVTGNVANCGTFTHVGWDAVRRFFDPIHDGMHGKFDWTIDEILVGENPDVIITKSTSDIDVTTDGFWNNKALTYHGRYIQIFRFDDRKIRSFEEYYDTALLNSIYGS